MNTTVKRGDPDFDATAVKFNGELICHDTLVSADAVSGVVVRRRLDADGRLTEDTYAATGMVRFIERNEAVMAKEPVLRGQETASVDTPSTKDAPEPDPQPEAEAVGEEDEPVKKTGRLKIQKD